ncbi:MAG TPA: 3-oxoadipate enol-lactonase [Gaiellaceae bacterium]|nr:3-oxoadipate enol-lactonase [Gaiellaceae bacterium]
MRLAHRFDGPEEAPLLVLSNSLGTTMRLWEPQLAAFTSGFRVLRHDHPGHGGSPVPDDPVSVEEIASAVLELIDDERFSFCGLSLGGMVGMCLAAAVPERVETLTLCCTGAKLGTGEEWAERAAMVRAEGTAALVDRSRERWFTPAFRDSATARSYLDELLAIDREGYARCCEALAGFDFRDRLGEIEAPTLVLVGEEDPVTPPEVVETLNEGIPNTETVVVPHASHLANVEQPDAVAAAVLQEVRS